MSAVTPVTLLDAVGASRKPSAWEDSVLVLVDHQREYIDGVLPLVGMPEAVAACADLLSLARQHGTPVIHVMHHGKGKGAFDRPGPMWHSLKGSRRRATSRLWSSTCPTASPARTWPRS